MPVLTDTIEVNGSGVQTLLTFTRIGAPQATSGGVQSSAVSLALTDGTGQFTKTLVAGSYTLQWRIDRGPLNQLEFSMPDVGGPYALYELAGDITDGTGAFEVDIAILGWTALKARTQHINNQLVKLAYLDDEGDFGGGFYRYVSTSEVAETKPDVAKPDDVSSDDPGRWHKDPMP